MPFWITISVCQSCKTLDIDLAYRSTSNFRDKIQLRPSPYACTLHHLHPITPLTHTTLQNEPRKYLSNFDFSEYIHSSFDYNVSVGAHRKWLPSPTHSVYHLSHTTHFLSFSSVCIYRYSFDRSITSLTHRTTNFLFHFFFPLNITDSDNK